MGLLYLFLPIEQEAERAPQPEGRGINPGCLKRGAFPAGHTLHLISSFCVTVLA